MRNQNENPADRFDRAVKSILGLSPEEAAEVSAEIPERIAQVAVDGYDTPKGAEARDLINDADAWFAAMKRRSKGR